MSRASKGIVKPWQKSLLYWAIAFLWLTGVGWLYFRYGTHWEDLESNSNSTQVLLLKVHGAAAMFFLVVLGLVIHHIGSGWRQKRQRLSGSLLAISCGALILTGWGLYYVGQESVRDIISQAHSWVGLFLPLIIFIHVWRIIRRRRKLITGQKRG